MGYLTKKFKSDTVLFDPIQHVEHFNLFHTRLPEMTAEERESWQKELRNWSSCADTPQSKRRESLMQLLK